VSKKHILLLGGTGFVGRRLAMTLHQIGHRVSVISRSLRAGIFPAEVNHYACSLEHKLTLNQLLPCVDAVIHMASASTPSTSTHNPTFEILHNVIPTAQFLEVFAEHQTPLLIYLSSGGAIYGNHLSEKASEQHVIAPLSYYGAGKASIESLLQAFCHQTKRNAIVLRPSNLYGPDQPERAGFGIIPTLIAKALRNEPVDIWGDGNTTRDYLHIDDFIELLCKIIGSNNHLDGCNIFNAGTGNGTTVNDLCKRIESISNIKLMREYHPIRAVDVQRIVLDTAKTNTTYNWAAITSLEEGLKETWRTATSASKQNTP
jgi:UDP-glucose 4-epimerase